MQDWVVFYGDQLKAQWTKLDNTGERRFDGRVFPSEAFPSDHAIVVMRLAPLPPPPTSPSTRGRLASADR